MKYMYWHHRRPWLRKRYTWPEYKCLKELEKNLAFSNFQIVVILSKWPWQASGSLRRVSFASLRWVFLIAIRRSEWSLQKSKKSCKGGVPLTLDYSGKLDPKRNPFVFLQLEKRLSSYDKIFHSPERHRLKYQSRSYRFLLKKLFNGSGGVLKLVYNTLIVYLHKSLLSSLPSPLGKEVKVLLTPQLALSQKTVYVTQWM